MWQFRRTTLRAARWMNSLQPIGDHLWSTPGSRYFFCRQCTHIILSLSTPEEALPKPPNEGPSILFHKHIPAYCGRLHTLGKYLCNRPDIAVLKVARLEATVSLVPPGPAYHFYLQRARYRTTAPAIGAPFPDKNC